MIKAHFMLLTGILSSQLAKGPLFSFLVDLIVNPNSCKREKYKGNCKDTKQKKAGRQQPNG